MRRSGYLLLLGTVLLATLTACDQAESPTGTLDRAGPSAPKFAESDTWEYMTETQPVYVELVAKDQTPQADDGVKRVCPNDQLIMKNAHLRMPYGLEGIDLDFRGPFQFVRHVSTTSPFPTAAYVFSQNAYTYDRKYYAPGGNQVLLACDGRYVINNSVIRLWVGHLYGKAYNGPIVRNPDYDEPGGTGGGGCGNEMETDTQIIYDPYDPDGLSGGTCGTGSGEREGDNDPTGEEGREEQPVDETVVFLCAWETWADGSFYMFCKRVD